MNAIYKYANKKNFKHVEPTLIEDFYINNKTRLGGYLISLELFTIIGFVTFLVLLTDIIATWIVLIICFTVIVILHYKEYINYVMELTKETDSYYWRFCQVVPEFLSIKQQIDKEENNGKYTHFYWHNLKTIQDAEKYNIQPYQLVKNIDMAEKESQVEYFFSKMNNEKDYTTVNFCQEQIYIICKSIIEQMKSNLNREINHRKVHSIIHQFTLTEPKEV